jgi:hypothetical protein
MGKSLSLGECIKGSATLCKIKIAAYFKYGKDRR